jgi:outer membrane lipoprotein-sorting protein
MVFNQFVAKRCPVWMGLALSSFLFFLPLVSIAFAGTLKPEEISSIQSKSASLKEFKSEFMQETYSARTKQTKSSEGVLQFKSPKSFRWETVKPKKELYVSNGQDLWKYVESRKHAQQIPSDKAQLDFLNVLFNLATLQEKYQVESWESGDALEPGLPDGGKETGIFLKLKPKGSHPGTQGQLAVFLQISRSMGNVSEMRIHFDNGNKTKLSFSEFKVQSQSADSFEFKVPKGVVVDKI